MTFLRRLFQLFLISNLAGLVFLFALAQLVGSGTALNSLFKSSGFYTVAATQAQTMLTTSPRVPEKYQAIFESAVKSTIDEDQIEAMIKPALVDISTWFNQPNGTLPPDVIIVIKPAKDALVTQLQTDGVSPAEALAFQTQLSQEIPDQIKLSSVVSLLNQENPTTTTGEMPSAEPADPSKANKATSPDALTQGLLNIKTVVTAARNAIPIAVGLALLWTILIMWLARRKGRAWLRSPAWCYMGVGVGWLLISLVLPALYTAPTEVLNEQNVVAHIIPILLKNALVAGQFAALGVLALGAVMYIASYFINKQPGALSSNVKPLPNQRPIKRA